MSNKVINQHFVPQMYLNRFANERKYLDVWDVNRDTIMPHQKSGNFGAKRYFYDFDRKTIENAMREMEDYHGISLKQFLDKEPQFIEKGLSKEESEAAKILDSLAENPDCLFETEIRLKLIIFMHDLAYRTETFRNQMANIHERDLEMLAEMRIDPQKVRGLQSAEENQAQQLLGLRPLLYTMQMLDQDYSWYYATVAGKYDLVISDDPLQPVRHEFNEICFPISGRKAIVLRVNGNVPMISFDNPDGHSLELSDWSVVKFNILQRAYANRYIFGNGESIKGCRIIWNNKKILSKSGAQPFHG